MNIKLNWWQTLVITLMFGSIANFTASVKADVASAASSGKTGEQAVSDEVLTKAEGLIAHVGSSNGLVAGVMTPVLQIAVPLAVAAVYSEVIAEVNNATVTGNAGAEAERQQIASGFTSAAQEQVAA